MFGYVSANTKTLTDEELKVYKGMYCGLCRTLKRRHGSLSRVTLTYDMTFLILVLSSLYGGNEVTGEECCIVHPLKKHSYIMTDFTEYAADMNIMLTYNKLIDDRNDDNSLTARLASLYFKNDYYKIWDKYPKQCASTEKYLAELNAVETKGVLSPDIPANIFGHLLAELFILNEDEYSDKLRRAMSSLGRFIYIMDAWDDLSADIKKEQYNPLTSVDSSHIESILTMLIADCTNELFTLPFQKNEGIIKNILYSGVWNKYALKTAKS